MTGKWTTFRLGDVCLKIGSGSTPRGGSNVYLDKGSIVLIRSQNVYNDGFCREGLVFLSNEHAQDLANVEVKEQDVLLNITGDSVARTCQVDSRFLPARVNQHVAIIRPDSTKLSPRYLHYFLISHAMQSKMLSLAGTGGTRNALTKGMIESFEIFAPENLEEQHAIAYILGVLDDKIELNRRMNETLEAIAQALFKSWFVDFDAVHARAEGRDTKMPPHISDVFPDSFCVSELGMIPKGWRIGIFGDIAKNLRRGVQPYGIESTTPYIALEHMQKRCIALNEWGIAEELASNKFIFKQNEILFGKLRPYFHKVAVAPVDGVCSTDILVIAPIKQSWFSFVLGHASSVTFVEYANAGSTGTKMPRTNWNDLAKYPIVLPPEDVAKAFDEQIQPIVASIIARIHQSHTLIEMRDTLLPKLISGELCVPDAERFIKDASL